MEIGMRRPKYEINLSDQERQNLTAIINQYTNKLSLIQRANIILMADEGWLYQDIAEELGIRKATVSIWTQRWATAPESANVIEKLQDLPRSGKPDKFTPEQLCKIFAIACEKPEDHGKPITHWTHRELAKTVVEKNIVDSISESYLGELLKKKDLQPHRIKYWLNVKADEKKDERIADICNIYINSKKSDSQQITISIDEMTGVQALERIAPDLMIRPGKPQAREFEYKRHGTQTLLGGLNVATGKIQALVGDTRKENDFVEFIKHLVESNPGYEKYHFVMDQLNTHKSASLVQYVADFCGIEDCLGVKGKEGILKSMVSREDFLCDCDKNIVFHYTPKHASWMNQIEIWFGILMKKVINRGNFLSKEDLKNKILTFIDYFNHTMAKPYRWTYQGKPLSI